MTALLLATPGLPLAAAAVLAASGGRLTRAAGAVATAASALALAAALAVVAGPQEVATATWFRLGGLTATLGLRADALAVAFAVLVAGVSVVVNVYAIGYVRGEEDVSRFFAWMALFQGAMLALVLSDSLVVLFAAWEAVGVASFALIAHRDREPEARRAGAQAFAATRAGDVALLAAVVLALRWTGTTDLAALLGAPLAPDRASAVAFLLLGAAVAKSAQLPLSAWLPDAMAGPTPVSALLHSATMVAAGAFLVLRAWPLFEAAPLALTALRWIGGATALAAALAATAAADLKRVLAWSTVDHLGLMMLALGLGSPVAAALHLFAHAAFKAGLFLTAGALEHATGTRALAELGGAARALPWTAGALVACALALAGVPPLAGFFSEERVLAAAAAASPAWASLSIALTLLAGVYAGRIVAAVVFRHGDADAPAHAAEPGWTMRGPSLVLALAAAGAGLALEPFRTRIFPFAEAASHVPAAWRVAALAASLAGLAFGVLRVRARGPVPALGGWPALVPATAAAVLDGAAVATRAAARASTGAENALDAGARGAAALAGRAASNARGAERALDAGARALARLTWAGARGVDVAERSGLDAGGRGAAAELGALGGRLRRTQAGPIYVYAAVAAGFVAAASAAALVAALVVGGRGAGG